MIDRFVRLDGESFHYLEAGDPAAPPLVLLHALGEEAHDWDGIAPRLADRYRVVALDQRCHGQSPASEHLSFETLRDDLAAFVDALGLARFTLVGHSMGGGISYLFAQRWPDRVERLVTEDVPPPRPESPRPLDPAWPQFARDVIGQLNQPYPGWWEGLARITAAALVIGGGSTSHVPQHRLAEVAARIPDARLVTIEGGGHFVHRERPEEFLRAVRGFLAGR